jgi:hypothetical protein
LKVKKLAWIMTAALALAVPRVHGQNQAPDSRSVNPTTPLPPMDASGGNRGGAKPVPAARGVSNGEPEQYDPSQVAPDTNTLAGAQLLGVGSLRQAHNVFDPSISVSLLGQTGVQQTVGQSSVIFTKIFGGSLAFSRVGSTSRFSANYSGGDTLSQPPQLSGQFHNISIAEQITLARWRFSLMDLFVLAPGAAFTGQGMGGPGLVDQFIETNQNSLSMLAQGFAPSQTIQTGPANRYVNTALGEASYSFTRRSAVTVVGSYGVLHFFDSGYVNSHMTTVQGGYDYLLDTKNSIAVIGSYANVAYTGTPTSTTDYKAQFAYGRKITGKLAFQASAGPEEIRAAGTLNGSFHIITGTANTSLKYEQRRSGTGVIFTRGLSNGSGVFFGAISDVFSGYAHHDFTRSLSAFISAGYAFNKALAPAGIPSISFNDWFFGASLNRRLGRYGSVALNYGVQDQSIPVACPVASCGTPGTGQTFGVSFNWHLRPIE